MNRVAPCRVCGEPCTAQSGTTHQPKHKSCWEHGRQGYRLHGCRCNACRSWQAAEQRKIRARRKGQGNPIRPKRPTEVRICEYCSGPYEAVKYSPNRFCSLDCANAKQRADTAALIGDVAPSRKRKKQSFTISRTARLAIYERDNWTCQICDEPIDRDAHYMNKWAATLDHIIPQSRQLVPDHSPKNLRLVHRRCNVIRGNLTHYSTDEAVRMRKEAS